MNIYKALPILEAKPIIEEDEQPIPREESNGICSISVMIPNTPMIIVTIAPVIVNQIGVLAPTEGQYVLYSF